MTARTHDHPNTIAAGENHNKQKSRNDRRAICEYIANRGADGGMDEDILRACPLVNANALRLRLTELKDDYLFITLSLGERRKNSLGNFCRVWHVTASGLRALNFSLQQFHVPDEV